MDHSNTYSTNTYQVLTNLTVPALWGWIGTGLVTPFCKILLFKSEGWWLWGQVLRHKRRNPNSCPERSVMETDQGVFNQWSRRTKETHLGDGKIYKGRDKQVWGTSAKAYYHQTERPVGVHWVPVLLENQKHMPSGDASTKNIFAPGFVLHL